MRRVSTDRISCKLRVLGVLSVGILLIGLIPSLVFGQQPPLPPLPQGQGVDSTLVQTPAQGDIVVSFEAGQVQVAKDADGLDVVQLDGFDTTLVPGAPRLPVLSKEFTLPLGAHATDVTVTDAEQTELPGQYRLRTVAAEAASDDSGMLLASFDAPASGRYPDSAVEVASTIQRDDAEVVVLRFYPVSYELSTGQLTFVQRATATIHYEIALPKLKLDTSGKRLLPLPSEPTGAEQDAEASAQAQKTGYLIVTTATLANSDAVGAFRRFKESEGFSVSVATPQEWATFPGKDDPDKLRAFLQKNWKAWNLRYLLIIGSTSAIPMKVLYPSAIEHSASWPTPSDVYYADLTGNWDGDGDGFPGEFGEDRPDLGAELYVGRIPFDADGIVGSILQKLIDYESTDGDWRQRALLAMAILDYNAYGGVQTDGAYLGAAMVSGYLANAGIETRRMYEEDGVSSSLPHDEPLDLNALAAQWVDGYGFVSWWGHGSATGAYRKIWAGGRVTNRPFVDIYHLASLTTDRPAVVFQNACLNGSTQTYSLGGQMLRYGAITTVAATAVTWYRTGWQALGDGGSASFTYNFGRALVVDGLTAGEALARSRESHAAKYLWSPGQQQTVLAFNLYGDPSLQLKPRTRSESAAVSLQQGWNLVAMPEIGHATPVAEALASIEGDYEMVQAYDPTSSDPWKTYAPGAEDNTLQTLDALQGFWVFATTDCTLEIEFDVPLVASSGVTLYPGWNLVGFPGETAVLVTDGLQAAGGAVDSIFSFTAGPDSSWLGYSVDTPAEQNTLTTLEPGTGYWLHANAPTVWSAR